MVCVRTVCKYLVSVPHPGFIQENARGFFRAQYPVADFQLQSDFRASDAIAFWFILLPYAPSLLEDEVDLVFS